MNGERKKERRRREPRGFDTNERTNERTSASVLRATCKDGLKGERRDLRITR